MRGIKIVIFLVLMALWTAGCGREENPGLTASGTVEARETMIGAEVGGKIVSLPVAEGDEVRAGQEIARIDDTALQWQVKQAEAAAAVAEAKLGETKKGNRVEQIRQAESAAGQVQALAEGARLAVDTAQDDYQRMKNLLDQGAATQQQYDAAKAKLDAARSQYESYLAQAKAAGEQAKLIKAGATEETVSAAQAGFNQALAAWEGAKVQWEKVRIKSPADGVITEKVAEEGETVNPGSTVAVVTDLKHLWLEVYVPEADLGKVSQGKKALIRVDAYPGQEFSGQVSYIAQKAEFTPKNVQTKEERTNMVFKVKVALDNEEGKLKPGMPGDVVFEE